MKKLFVTLLVLLFVAAIIGCTPITPTPTLRPTQTVTPRPRTAVPTTTSVISTKTPTPTAIVIPERIVQEFTPVFNSPLGEAYLTQEVFEGTPGQVFTEVVLITTYKDVEVHGFSFPGYVCSTDTDPYGIGNVTTSTGGIGPDVTRKYDIEIWPDSLPGESCSTAIKVRLDGEDNTSYELFVPITIIVK